MENSTARSNQKPNLSSPCMNGPTSSNNPAAMNKQLRIRTEKDLELNLSLNGRFGVDTTTSSKKLKRSRATATPPFAIKSADAAAELNAPTHDYHAPPADVEGMSGAAPQMMRFSSWPVTEQSILDDHRLMSREARKLRSEKMRHNPSLVKYRANKMHGGAGHSRHSAAGPSRTVARKTKSTLPPSRKCIGSSSAIDHNSPAGGQQHRPIMQIEGANMQAVAAAQFQVRAANGSASSRNARLNQTANGSTTIRNVRPYQAMTARNAQLLDQWANGNAIAGNVMSDPSANGNANGGNALPDRMPYVFTGVGGHCRVFGFLYRYTVEEIKIVCVCHAMFFTPAEFVEHGCGHQVEHPMSHIWVMPFPFPC